MIAIQSHIRSLECYVERCGGSVVWDLLPDAIHGELSRDCITLHAGLDPYQQLLALVHELTHWLAHRDIPRDFGACATIYEYEAEAVESLVMGRLGLSRPAEDAAVEDCDRPTDGLLTASLVRVRSAVHRICQILELERDLTELETQAAVHVQAAAREEFVLEDEAHRVGDFLGEPQALQWHRRGELAEHLGAHGR